MGAYLIAVVHQEAMNANRSKDIAATGLQFQSRRRPD